MHLDMYVGSGARVTPFSYFNSQKQKTEEYKAVPFITNDEGKTKHHSMQVEVGETCKDGDLILDNHVIEAYYDSKRELWEPYRVRFDKTFEAIINKLPTMNNIRTALSIWNTIIDPITLNNISKGLPVSNGREGVYYEGVGKQDTLTNMRKLHNHIKNDIFQEVKTLLHKKVGTRLLDVACGKGGDLRKWYNADFETVLGIDLSEDNIVNQDDGLYTRLNDMKLLGNKKFVFVPMDMTKKLGIDQLPNIKDIFLKDIAECLWAPDKKTKCRDEISNLRGLATQPFDVVSCQFAIHYCFETSEKLSTFISNVANNLRPGGYFIGTCFDGDSVNTLLKSKGGNAVGLINGKKVWHIARTYTRTYDSKRFGQTINVLVDSIGKEHIESLVPFPLLQERMEAANMKLIKSKMFGDIQNLSKMEEAEQSLSKLNRYFIFQKNN
jgi:2-polyprenyl-3-methyl-5-hydroxy-6-metoxy-1,4-benzoquinol methylase